MIEAVLAKSISASSVSRVASFASSCSSASCWAVCWEESCRVSVRSCAFLTFSAASLACSGRVSTYCLTVSRASSTPGRRAVMAESNSRSMSARSASAEIIGSSFQRRDEIRSLAALICFPYRRTPSFRVSSSGLSLALTMVETGHSIPTAIRSIW